MHIRGSDSFNTDFHSIRDEPFALPLLGYKLAPMTIDPWGLPGPIPTGAGGSSMFKVTSPPSGQFLQPGRPQLTSSEPKRLQLRLQLNLTNTQLTPN